MGYQQLAAVAVALAIVIFLSGPLRLLFVVFLALGVLVRMLDRGYIELGPNHLVVRGNFYARVLYADVLGIEVFQPQWEGWFGSLNRNIGRLIEQIHSADFVAANWPDYTVNLRKPIWILSLFPLPFPMRKRRIYLTIETRQSQGFTSNLEDHLRTAGHPP